MANKKKIEEREKVLKSKQNEQLVQRIGIGVIALVVLGLIYMLATNRSAQPADDPLTTLPPVTQEPAVDAPGKQYAAYPEVTIDTSRKYFATVKMAKGSEFVIELFPEEAPLAVNSFVFLARDGYFDGVTFHRVLEGFMAQGGDPTGTGMGGPGYEFANEDSDLTFDKEGVVAMANAGRDTNGSQFFITFGPTPQLNGGYTIFGQVVDGMDVVNSITRREPGSGIPGDAIETITITEQ